MRIWTATVFALLSAACGQAPEEGLQEGDVIFQRSQSSQSEAIRLATGSEWSHCGLMARGEGGRWYVFEAVQPVKLTPLDEWVARGRGGKYVVRRLRDDSLLTPARLQKMREIATGWTGRSYDMAFEWSDERLYCSELVWKIYRRAVGIEVGQLQTLGDLDLTAPAVKTKLRERYGAQIPYDQKVITPAAIFDSEALVTVKTK
ncbi:MAG: YiiX family permuted papain-like enzyme [Rikenellaceae bacterium]|jgi:hypothetical protein|nr:YiiX family permuted papain-like enzyme [Rikenellaceae bacterium]